MTSTTPLETEIETGINTGTSIARHDAGSLGSVTSGLGATIGVDSLAYGTGGWLGPATS